MNTQHSSSRPNHSKLAEYHALNWKPCVMTTPLPLCFYPVLVVIPHQSTRLQNQVIILTSASFLFIPPSSHYLTSPLANGQLPPASCCRQHLGPILHVPATV